VLPRVLRRPVRVLARMCSDDARAPRFGVTIATGILFGATALYGSFLGGQLPGFVQAVTARTGFAMSQVQVVGNKETSEIDVIQEVGLDGWTSLIGFDASGARARVAALPWVEGAAVQKIYPGTLEVRIVEKKPFAIWQHGSELTVVEKDGKPIAPLVTGRHASLPVVIGMGAAEQGAGFIAQVAKYPALASQVVAYSFIAERRWDLRLRNGITVKLPERDADEALAELVAMDGAERLFSRDIVSVDMRLADRIFVRLSPEAAEQRAEVLKKKLGKEYVRKEKAI
jgi:cell division protein FtsQ